MVNVLATPEFRSFVDRIARRELGHLLLSLRLREGKNSDPIDEFVDALAEAREMEESEEYVEIQEDIINTFLESCGVYERARLNGDLIDVADESRAGSACQSALCGEPVYQITLEGRAVARYLRGTGFE